MPISVANGKQRINNQKYRKHVDKKSETTRKLHHHINNKKYEKQRINNQKNEFINNQQYISLCSWHFYKSALNLETELCWICSVSGEYKKYYENNQIEQVYLNFRIFCTFASNPSTSTEIELCLLQKSFILEECWGW